MPDKNITGKVPYDSFKEKGFQAVTEWYEQIGAKDVRNVHVNPNTTIKICEALNEFHNDSCGVNMAFAMYGPSGFHDDVPDDMFKHIVNKE